jgi:branched-chain amino acid transport system substrate-binding protein
MKNMLNGLFLMLLAGLAAGANASEPIKIGVVTPLSGTYAPIGNQVKHGIELATKEINAAGGIAGRKIELLIEDGEANPPAAVQKAEKLFQVGKVDFLTGTVNSGATLAVGQTAERNNRLIATTVSFANAITGKQCSPNVFRVNANAGMQSATLAEWLTREKPKARIFYLGPDYEMGRSTVASFRGMAEQRGATTVGQLFAPLGTKDYTPFFGQIRSAHPNVLYTSVAGNDTVRLLTQMSSYGVSKGLTLIGAAGVVTPQNIGALGAAANGFITAAAYSPELDVPENRKFVAAFRAAFNEEPGLYATDSYGVVYFYKAAVEKAGSTDTAKVRAAMEGLKWDTPEGVKKMRAGDHQAIQEMYAVQVVDGKFKIIGKIDGKVAVGPDTCTRF